MRAPRAYLAGFGTSGSLLAGAALLFILASAFIGFHGWPQLGDSPSTVAVTLPRAPIGTATSRASRALSTTTASTASSHVAALRPGRVAGQAGVPGSAGGVVHGGTTLGGGPVHQGGTTSTTPGGHTGPAPTNCVSGCTHTPPVQIPQPVSTPLNHAHHAVHKIVTTVQRVLPVHVPLPGSGTGSGSPGSTVHHVTSAAGSAVKGAGSAAHKTVSGATSTVHHLLP